MKDFIFAASLALFLTGSVFIIYRNYRLAEDCGGFNAGFARMYPPFIVLMDIRHPSCPGWAADKYRRYKEQHAVFFVAALLIFFLTK